MILNIVSLSLALGALMVLAALWLLRRGVLYLFLFVLAPRVPAGGLLESVALPVFPRPSTSARPDWWLPGRWPCTPSTTDQWVRA